MSDELTERGGDRGLIRIAQGDRGRSWVVTVRVGDTAEELQRAYDVAKRIEAQLRADDPPVKANRRRL